MLLGIGKLKEVVDILKDKEVKEIEISSIINVLEI